jgi:hypothetical protein
MHASCPAHLMLLDLTIPIISIGLCGYKASHDVIFCALSLRFKYFPQHPAQYLTYRMVGL